MARKVQVVDGGATGSDELEIDSAGRLIAKIQDSAGQELDVNAAGGLNTTVVSSGGVELGITAGGGIKHPRLSKTVTGTDSLTSTNAKTAFSKAWRLLGVLVHFSGAQSNAVGVYLDAAAGAAYDTLLYTITFASNTDGVWLLNAPLPLAQGDEVYLTWTQPGAITVGAQIIGEEA